MTRAERGIAIMIGAACGVAILAAIAKPFLPFLPLLWWGVVAVQEQQVLVEDHREPDFRLYVIERSFVGESHTIYARETGARYSDQVARLHVDTWGDVIDGGSLHFEWYEEEQLVALLGRETRAPGTLLYLALMRFDESGRVTEVPLDVDRVGVIGDKPGSEMRKARSAEIERILAGRERPLPGTATATLAPP